MAFASRMQARLPLGPLARGFLTTPQASLDAADWPVAPRPASTPGSRPTPGAALPGTLASPRAGLPPAGCRELVARLRRGALLSLVLGARATGRTFLRNHPVVSARGRPAWPRPPPGGVDADPRRRARVKAAAGGPTGTRALDAARDRRGIRPGGCENGRSAAGGRGPAAAPAPPARPLPPTPPLDWSWEHDHEHKQWLGGSAAGVGRLAAEASRGGGRRSGMLCGQCAGRRRTRCAG
jgi:hypothetical protein